MQPESSRREFLLGSTVAAGLVAAGDRPALADDPHQRMHGAATFPRDHPGPGGPVGSPNDRGKLVPGRRNPNDPPVPIEAPDLTKLSWAMKDGVKEFHLHCRHTRREFLPGMWFDVWGYNGSMPGPTIEAVEGDRVRVIVHNELPESTTIHWHGLEVPNRMDGVHGVTQDPIKPGATFTYEFTLHQNGTFFYHSHGPMQEGMGMVGLFIVHPRAAYQPVVDHDFALVIQEWAILPLSTVPNTMSMEFNFFTINGRSGPYTTPLIVRLGNRVRIRFLNMSPIDHHPMHLHGHTFWVTGTEGGRIPESAWIPSNNTLVGVAQVREVEFIANNPGDWLIHCHMFHHMMNHMTSMVGPMAGHSMGGMPAGQGMQNSLGMLSLGRAEPMRRELGPALGRGTGEQTGSEREVGNGPHQAGQSGHDHGMHDMKDHQAMGHDMMSEADKRKVPGYPQDMMDMMGMYSDEQLRKLNRPQTRGMRRGWYAGVEALHTVLRVLPDDLYEKVVSGKGDVMPGASVPGSDAGGMHDHKH